MENRDKNKNTSAEFSQKEGESMRNRDEKDVNNIDRSSGSELNESTRRPGSSYDSSTGRSGSGNQSSGSDRLRDEHISRDDLENRGKSGSMGNPSRDQDV
jgi:hypothetical protein